MSRPIFDRTVKLAVAIVENTTQPPEEAILTALGLVAPSNTTNESVPPSELREAVETKLFVHRGLGI